MLWIHTDQGADSFTAELSADDLAQLNDLLDEILENKRLWTFSAQRDAFVRRSIYRLLAILVNRKKGDNHPKSRLNYKSDPGQILYILSYLSLVAQSYIRHWQLSSLAH